MLFGRQDGARIWEQAMNKAHDALVAGQFGPRANAYVESAVHARGEDLGALEAVVEKIRPARALDLGCGGGHVAYLLARHAARVVAVDLSADMLAAVAETAKDKKLSNIETHRASVERLPFGDASFDCVVTRYSAHHWLDFEGGLREARRVAKPGSPAIFMDVFTPGVPLLDTHLQSLELLRDTSHVRNYTVAEWSGALARAGFALKSAHTWRLHLEFESWIQRMRTPQVFTAAIRALQSGAPQEVRDHFAIKPDGSFTIDTMMLETIAG
jgi:ubiquinone/menaquinone biosynthesis C-methylase UbiE